MFGKRNIEKEGIKNVFLYCTTSNIYDSFWNIYIYIFIRRILNLLMKDKKIKQQKIISLVLTLLIMIPALKVWGTWAVVVVHIVIIAWVVELIYFIIKKFTNNSFSYCLNRIKQHTFYILGERVFNVYSLLGLLDL